MAFCNNCGAELPENSKFCTSCGTKNEDTPQVTPVEETPVYESTEQKSAYTVPQGAPVQKEKKPLNKKLFIIIGAAVLALILIIVVIAVVSNIVKTNKAIKDKTLALKEEHFEVEFSGYEELDPSMDIEFTDEFEEDALEALGYSKKTTKDKAHRELSDLKYAIDFEYEGLETLSNGDELTIKVYLYEDYDSDEKLDFVTTSAKKKDKKDADVIIKEFELKVTVEGLKEVVKYNPFDDLEVDTYGADGDVYVDWTYLGEHELGYYDFDCDNEYDLSIGDEFTITVDEYTVEWLLEYYGVQLTETSKTFTVETADKYLTSAKDISDSLLEDMQEDAEYEIEDEYYWCDCTISDLEYKGLYFLNLKEDEWGDENKVILAYQGTATPDDDDYDPFTVWVGVEFTEAFEYADGTQEVDYYCYFVYEYEYIHPDSWDSFYGYFTEKALYEDVVSDYDEYDIEIAGDLIDYSTYVEEEVTYDTIQEYFESEDGEEFIASQEENLMDIYGDTYSDVQFTAEDDVITYAYTYIEEQDASLFEDLLSEEDFDSDFETWESATGISEMSIQVIYYNPDGSELYNETFSNF